MASHGVARTAGANIRTKEGREKELQQIAAYRDLVDLVNTKVAERQYTFEVLALTTKLLNENPEYYTIWNHRRRILRNLLSDYASETSTSASTSSRIEELVNGEIQLTFILLRKYPKCYWIWNHRNWILQEGETMLDAATAQKLWMGELQIVSKMLHSDSRNFHAWSYRRFVVSQLERISASSATSLDANSGSQQSHLETEFDYTTKMIKMNLSNFSAWHNRSKLIPRVLDQRGADRVSRKKMLEDELALICTAINTDPFDQSIWYYHQFLMSTLSPKCEPHSRIVLDLSNQDRQRYYENEMQYIREILDDEADCKWIYVALLHCASCYLEVDGGTRAFTTMDMRSWLEALQRLDPLRTGRWVDLGRSLNI